MAVSTEYNCDCLPGCNKVEYTYKMQVEDLDPDQFCPGEPFFELD